MNFGASLFDIVHAKKNIIIYVFDGSPPNPVGGLPLKTAGLTIGTKDHWPRHQGPLVLGLCPPWPVLGSWIPLKRKKTMQKTVERTKLRAEAQDGQHD